jgi:hypothetical protein
MPRTGTAIFYSPILQALDHLFRLGATVNHDRI